MKRKSPQSNERNRFSPAFQSRGVDAAGAVAKFQLQEQVAVAIGLQLLVGDEIDFLEVFAIVESFHETPAHANPPSGLRRAID